ncbi:GNAT family N-acetyltransferase [Alteromonas gracilis]|uniref:GNAT family N-acetyltransferase n=1 Tax=Alteromonas gracilis TaxID=1479524 RepID=UPI0037361A96
MQITLIPTTDLPRAAQLTFDNMKVYYAQYAPDWDANKVLEATSSLENFDIVVQQEVVGVMRLQYEAESCIVRDLQVMSNAQNKGIGRAALQEAKRLALNAELNALSLRVFKISPAVNLYLSDGFIVQSEDDRFFNMVKTLIA